MYYTERVDDFQITDVTYWPGCAPAYVPPEYAIVKWEAHDPTEAYDLKTGKMKTVVESCYVVANLKWNVHESGFDFESVGMRWLESNPSPAVIDMVKRFAAEKEEELSAINESINRKSSWEESLNGADTYFRCPFCGMKFYGSSAPGRHCPNCGRRVYTYFL